MLLRTLLLVPAQVVSDEALLRRYQNEIAQLRQQLAAVRAALDVAWGQCLCAGAEPLGHFLAGALT